MSIPKWDHRFLDLAEHISNWSKDPSTKVGAVIVNDCNQIISIGYNGFPQNVPDDPSMLFDRDIKYKVIVHGEMNAILFANQSLQSCTLYTYPFMPCPNCASVVIQKKIKRVVSYTCQIDRWKSNLEISRWLFKQAKVELIEYEQRS
jgi:dCMP deaminase